MSIITSGDMPLNVRDHSYLMGETMMTVWFTKYGIPMEFLEEGMDIVREETAEFMNQISPYQMAPSTVDPIAKGLQYAEKEAKKNEVFKEGEFRNFDAIVRATIQMVQVAAIADQEYAPIEEAQKQEANRVGRGR